MPKQDTQLPRYWPILFILNKLTTLSSHFRLQKYIFLAKTEKKIPMQYIFVKETHGPYCVEIKQDARELNEEGLIGMNWDSDRSAWTLVKGEDSVEEIETIVEQIPEKWKKNLNATIEKYEKFSTTKLEEYVYKHHVKSREHNDKIVSSIKSTIANLEKLTDKYPPNYNSYLIKSISEYCCLALKRLPKDLIQQSYLVRNVFHLLSSTAEIVELVDNNPECLSKMDLRDIEESFEHTQSVCKEVTSLPMLEDLDLSHIVNPQ